MRVPSLVACLLLLVATASGGDEPGTARIGLEGVSAVVTQPAGTWDQAVTSPAQGQWLLEYSDPEGQALLRAYVFPKGHVSNPEQALVQAVDVFFRGLRVEGFGLPTRRGLDVWGCPGAEGTIAAVVHGKRIGGRARLIFASATHWAFAIGYAEQGASQSKRDAVHLFAGSLEPTTPRFFARAFHRPADHAEVIVEKDGEEPITEGMLAAAEALLEVGVGARFPLGLKPAVRHALLSDARDGPPKTRKGYRDALALVRNAMGMKPDVRKASLNIVGKRLLHAILQRASQQYVPAVRFAVAWQEHRLLSIGEREDGLTGGDLANGIELSEFLASVAADRGIVADADARKRLHGRLTARWEKLSPEVRAEGRAWGEIWAALRHAWDVAAEADRLAFRAAVASRLHRSADGAPVVAPSGARALKTWLDARPREGLDARVLDAAFDLTNAERRDLVAILGAKDPYGYHFGW